MAKKKTKPRTGMIGPYTLHRIERDIAEGISLSVNWRNWGKSKCARTTAIHWRPPFDPNYALARAIIDRVHASDGPMPLELDGHLYLITEVPGRLVPSKAGGVKYQPPKDYSPRHSLDGVRAVRHGGGAKKASSPAGEDG